MAEERWWKAPGKVALTSTETNTIFGLHWLGKPRTTRWPRNELLSRLIGEEAPHGLMRDGGEPPICGGLRPDHRREIRATHNLTEQRKGRKCGRSRGRREGRKKENSGKTQSE